MSALPIKIDWFIGYRELDSLLDRKVREKKEKNIRFTVNLVRQ